MKELPSNTLPLTNLSKIVGWLDYKDRIRLTVRDGGVKIPTPEGGYIWYPLAAVDWDSLPRGKHAWPALRSKLRSLYSGEWRLEGRHDGPVAVFRNLVLEIELPVPRRIDLTDHIDITDVVKRALLNYPEFTSQATLQDPSLVLSALHDLTPSLLEEDDDSITTFTVKNTLNGDLSVAGRYAGKAITFKYSDCKHSARISKEAFLTIRHFIRTNKGNDSCVMKTPLRS